MYIETNKDEPSPGAVVNLQTIHNRKYNLSKNNAGISEETEAETLISCMKRQIFVKSVKFEEDRYVACSYKDYMLDDLARFCFKGDSYLNVDTTFDVIPGLWLTDTTYKHLALIDKNGNHPEFPGPSMLHFHKDRKEYRSLALEIVAQRPELLGIHTIGHDLDKATALGFKDVFRQSKHLWCTQHLQGCTSKKLRDMNVSQRLHNRIMADLYGTQDGFLVEQGLADADDVQDFDAKVRA